MALIEKKIPQTSQINAEKWIRTFVFALLYAVA